ncbi:uncharacterized protein RHIMIDRAFT_235610 [Rhizopus microsporus ATCC 52813]|uniref:Uncharacterized protein n=3 Tax=Rhizopus TaxID=4842 RepID=A0A2G4T1H3_RHIZD|nr:uncharacterized protein RHIMIDRAFT_235610 [Rhizopus microsporus ATCC 52813]PHZ14857.1 hypothetical protein RHIMIDRAFT_235610 [Rhizopus microsporus ATCC 52813]
MKHTTLDTKLTMESRQESKQSDKILYFERDLVGTPTSSRSCSLFDVCNCCGKQNCETLEYFNKTIKKLESDTRLAAEIGQGLLHKHETFVAESNQQTAKLNKQLEEYHIRIHDLEQSLEQVENQKDELLQEKNKLCWEHQKRQKMLDETVSDLEITNEKCQQLTAELESKNSELEKLRVFKFMVRQSELREETLTSKLEDTYQELAICRKNELLLESKIKKLRTKYESLYNAYEQLTRETNNNVSNPGSMTHHPTFMANNNSNSHQTAVKPTHAKYHKPRLPPKNDDEFVDYIKEISSTNTKLKSDILSYKEQLSEAREEIVSLNQKIQDNTPPDTIYRNNNNNNNNTTTLEREIMNNKRKKRAASVKSKDKVQNVPIRSKTTIIPPLPTVSSSMPTTSMATTGNAASSHGNAIVHHHYHYYVKNNNNEESSTSSCADFDCYDETIITTEKRNKPMMTKEPKNLVLSPSTSLSTTRNAPDEAKLRFPFAILQDQVSQIVNRLRGSDIRVLNRKLKRAFDIVELSSMSNSVIENILMDIDTLDNRFLWMKEEVEEELTAFFPFLEVLKNTLKELGSAKITVNDLQMAYVQKIEENEIRVEEEIMKKRQQKRKQSANNKEVSPMAWLTNIFYKSSSSTSNSSTSHLVSPVLDDDETLVRSHKDDPLLSRSNRRVVTYRYKTASPGVPIVRSKRSSHRLDEGAMRSMMIPTENVNNTNRDVPTVNLSSSWLGGK